MPGLYLNMVRAGVVDHSRDWPFCGFHEIQQTPVRYRIVNHIALRDVFGVRSIDRMRRIHRNWVDAELAREKPRERDPRWTESIAVGQREYLENFKLELGSRACGRREVKLERGYQLKEEFLLYTQKSR